MQIVLFALHVLDQLGFVPIYQLAAQNGEAFGQFGERHALAPAATVHAARKSHGAALRGLVNRDDLQGELLILDGDTQQVLLLAAALGQRAGHRSDDPPLDLTLERARAIFGAVAVLQHEIDHGVVDLHQNIAPGDAVAQQNLVQFAPGNIAHGLRAELPKDHDLIEAVDEFRAEVLLDLGQIMIAAASR